MIRIAVTLDRQYCKKNVGKRCSRIWRWGIYLDLRGK